MANQKRSNKNNNFGKKGDFKNKRTAGCKSENPKSYKGSRSQSQPGDTSSCGDKMSALNDFGWYNGIPVLLDSSAKIPYANVPGQDSTMEWNTFTTGDIDPQSKAVIPYGGVWVMRWCPSVGRSTDNTSPISLAAREIYANIRAVYSGTLPEDPPDLVMYLMALDSIFSYLSYLKKIYRALETYSPYNKAMPALILAQCGIEPADAAALRQDRANLRNAINNLITMSYKFHCPDVMTVFKRHYWLSSNIYADHDHVKAQFYHFVPEFFYKFVENSTTGGYLTPAGLPGPTVSAYYTYGLNLIQALGDWEESYTISGHLMRAYEGKPEFKVDYLDEHEFLDVVFVPEVLMQIHNSMSGGDTVDYASWNITQDPTTNAVLHTPRVQFTTRTGIHDITRSFYSARSNIFLDPAKDNPSVEDNIVATRLQYRLISDTNTNPDKKNNQTWFDVDCGTELLTRSQVFFFSQSATDSIYGFAFRAFVNGTPDEPEIGGMNYGDLAMVANFDWAPVCWVRGADDNGHVFFIPATDVYNPTYISGETLSNMHRACLLSEFGTFA